MTQEPEFDRQAFITPVETRKPPSSAIGPLLFILFVLGLAGAGGYLYVRSKGVPALAFNQEPSYAELTARVEELEKRLERVEKRRSTQPPATPAKDPGVVSSRPSTEPRPAKSAISVSPPRATGDARSSRPSGDVRAVQAELDAAQQAWDAAAERIGETVGELGAQRKEIDQAKSKLEEFSKQAERSRVSFQVQRHQSRLRVGPVWLKLRGVDSKKQRYTMNVFLDDKWVEVKDRVLLEPVELYLPTFRNPLELVVSEIYSDRVTGFLLVPKEEQNLSYRSN